ncbi:hypothetical protein IB270_30490 [Ensifer sp. ENS05]|uniref:hypothetical protein n=1 Tax=Ensifer sp. ENS05 TaxID=2769277 RepID=UPI00177E908C|nr:hypothetical protein [Ensifer sp. ENS05]MBD9597165.1 hypothetical protein [Ensifer sp. ENS05]
MRLLTRRSVLIETSEPAWIKPEMLVRLAPLRSWSQAKTADGGSYRAWTWISGNGPKWVGEISRWIRDRVPRDENGVPIYGSDNPSRHFIVQYVNPGADSSTTYSWDFDANISQTIQEDRIVDAGSPQAMIRAGRNLDVTATNLTNSYSAIEADGNATLKGTAFSNEGLALNRTVQTTCNARGACEAYDANGNRDPSRDIASRRHLYRLKSGDDRCRSGNGKGRRASRHQRFCQV